MNPLDTGADFINTLFNWFQVASIILIYGYFWQLYERRKLKRAWKEIVIRKNLKGIWSNIDIDNLEPKV
jgi:hypothetical protein